MRLVIHPGAPKTATTSFQAFLRANRDRLAARGVTVATPPEIRDHVYMTRYRSRYHRGKPMTDWVLAQFAERFAGAKTAILSEEGFTSAFMPALRPPGRGIDKAALSAALIASLPVDDLRVVLTIRGQAGLLASTHAHKVRMHRETRGLARWVREDVDLSALSWGRAIDAFAARLPGGALAVLPYEIMKAAGAERYFRAILEAGGIDPEGLVFDGDLSRNRSPSAPALWAARAANVALDGAAAASAKRRIMAALPAGRLPAIAPGPALARELDRRYGAENAALAAKWFPRHAVAFAPGRGAADTS